MRISPMNQSITANRMNQNASANKSNSTPLNQHSNVNFGTTVLPPAIEKLTEALSSAKTFNKSQNSSERESLVKEAKALLKNIRLLAGDNFPKHTVSVVTHGNGGHALVLNEGGAKLGEIGNFCSEIQTNNAQKELKTLITSLTPKKISAFITKRTQEIEADKAAKALAEQQEVAFAKTIAELKELASKPQAQ